MKSHKILGVPIRDFAIMVAAIAVVATLFHSFEWKFASVFTAKGVTFTLRQFGYDAIREGIDVFSGKAWSMIVRDCTLLDTMCYVTVFLWSCRAPWKSALRILIVCALIFALNNLRIVFAIIMWGKGVPNFFAHDIEGQGLWLLPLVPTLLWWWRTHIVADATDSEKRAKKIGFGKCVLIGVPAYVIILFFQLLIQVEMRSITELGNIPLLKFMMSFPGRSDVNKRYEYGTALQSATSQGKMEIAEYLLSRGADVNVTNKFGISMLHSSAYDGHVMLAKFLLENGADANAKSPHGMTPLHVAAFDGHLGSATCLWCDPHHRHATNSVDYRVIAEMLVANGADVNAPMTNNITPLHFAARMGSTNMVTFLLDNGANVNVPCEFKHRGWISTGFTPLHTAACAGSVEVVFILLAHGAKVNERFLITKNETEFVDNTTALWVAAHLGFKNIAVQLLEAGADPTIKASNGKSPADIAQDEGFDELAELLRAAEKASDF